MKNCKQLGAYHGLAGFYVFYPAELLPESACAQTGRRRNCSAKSKCNQDRTHHHIHPSDCESNSPSQAHFFERINHSRNALTGCDQTVCPA
jgi:endonuclease I